MVSQVPESLPPTHKIITILDLASVSIRANDGSDIPISVLVVPKIAAPLQNLIPDQGDSYPHLHGLPLAHPVQAILSFPC